MGSTSESPGDGVRGGDGAPFDSSDMPTLANAGGSLPPMPDAGDDAMPRGTRFGDFEILSERGRGGMGVVYRARQHHPERVVAIKVIRAGAARGDALRRFELEAGALARLNHPNIAAIYDAGWAEAAWTDGGSGSQPYFAMELVEGRTLDEYCDVHALDMRARLRLVAKVADAVQHAHTRGVVHRDLKPANVLVTDAGEPKVLDFGVARLTDEDVRSATIATQAGQLVGTVPYMSPEQIAGDPAALDARSDVYTLGVILFELLAGRLPFEADGRTVYALTRTIAEGEAPRLSRVDKRLRGDIETIVTKAMEKDPDRRYQAAGEVAADIERYLVNEPIEARPASAAYRARKFAARNKVLVGGVAAVMVALAGGLATSLVLLERAVEAEAVAIASEQRALAEADRARQVGGFARRMITGIDPEVAKDRDTTLLREVVDNAAAGLDETPPEDARVGGELRDMIGSAYLAIGRLADAETHLSRSVERWKDAGELGRADADGSASATLRLAQLRMEQGMLEEAGELMTSASGAVDNASDPEVRVRTMEQLAGLEFMRGHVLEAIAGLEGAIELSSQTLGESHERTLDLRANRGLLLGVAQRYDEAEEELRSAIERSSRERGEADAKTLMLRNNLATLMVQTGRADEARAEMERVVGAAERVFGADHPWTFTSRHNEALIPLEYNEPEVALGLYRPLVADAERVLGLDAPLTLRVRTGLANALRLSGQPDEALVVAEETYARAVQRLGEDHPDTARQQMTLGLLAAESGDAEGAERWYRSSISMLERTLGASHVETLTGVSNLANTLRRLGRLEEAEGLARRALEGQIKSLGAESFQAMIAHNALGLILTDMQRYDEALPHARAVADIAAKEFPEGHINIAGMRLRHAQAAQRAGASDEALDAGRSAQAGLEAVLGAEHPLSVEARTLVEALSGADPEADPQAGDDEGVSAGEGR